MEDYVSIMHIDKCTCYSMYLLCTCYKCTCYSMYLLCTCYKCICYNMYLLCTCYKCTYYTLCYSLYTGKSEVLLIDTEYDYIKCWLYKQVVLTFHK